MATESPGHSEISPTVVVCTDVAQDAQRRELLDDYLSEYGQYLAVPRRIRYQ